MPYTPPSARSPAASRPTTPRSDSFSKPNPLSPTLSSHGSRTHLPYSSSSQDYLSKHRRSPSVTDLNLIGSTSTNSSAAEFKTSHNETATSPTATSKSSSKHSASATQPATAPRDSLIGSPTSSDEDLSGQRGRGRAVANLAELQAAIRIIEQHRSGSPDDQAFKETMEARRTLGLPKSQINSDATSGLPPTTSPSRPPLSDGARKISHSRSNTETSAFLDFPRNKFECPETTSRRSSTSDGGDEEDDDSDLSIKPTLLRKKSGELVRPALRASSTRRRPSSMPGTPTYSKAVHFQEGSLEHVRHFLQVDRPIAVSAGSSPVESFDEEMEFPFGPPFDWEIRLTNFPADPLSQLVHPVKVEKVYLSADTKYLIGAIVVKNMAFHKLVVARFTLDHWKTTSEVVAEYSTDVRKKLANEGYDRFTFNIKLEDQANLENKTMFFCIRYNVNGVDYWDNNSSYNYQIDFSKKFKPQNGKSGQVGRGGRPLPRSKPSIEFASPALRPRSMPSFDDFGITPNDFNSILSANTVGESPIRFRNRPSPQGITDSTGKKGSSAQQAFGNRYDFGASLSAAMQLPSSGSSTSQQAKSSSSSTGSNASMLSIQTSPSAGKSVSSAEASKPKSTETAKPAALTAGKPTLQSPSYHELLDKYCFFGSAGKATSTPSPAQPRRPAQIDGASDESLKPASSVMSAAPSIPSVAAAPRTASPAEERRPASKVSTPHLSRSTSPGNGSSMGSRSASPAYGYPYHQSMQTGFFDTHTPTAIRG